jgi:rhodanese-related sulfurtransferase
VGPVTLASLLGRARERLQRLSPPEALVAMEHGAVMIDIRGADQIARDGTIAGALVIARNVLEWRLAPDSAWRHPDAPGIEQPVIVLCDEGYQSSLAAATLQDFGFARATDVIGGFGLWRTLGLPVNGPVRPAPDHTGRTPAGMLSARAAARAGRGTPPPAPPPSPRRR